MGYNFTDYRNTYMLAAQKLSTNPEEIAKYSTVVIMWLPWSFWIPLWTRIGNINLAHDKEVQTVQTCRWSCHWTTTREERQLFCSTYFRRVILLTPKRQGHSTLTHLHGCKGNNKSHALCLSANCFTDAVVVRGARRVRCGFTGKVIEKKRLRQDQRQSLHLVFDENREHVLIKHAIMLRCRRVVHSCTGSNPDFVNKHPVVLLYKKK